MNHYVHQCIHGIVVGQCRCPNPTKNLIIVDCPPDCEEKQRNLAVDRFAMLMKKKLSENTHKGSWKNDVDYELFIKLVDEVFELAIAIESGVKLDIQLECADVANFAMMISDNSQ